MIDLPLIDLVGRLKSFLVAHGENRDGIAILSGLGPTVHLLRVQAPLAAETTEFGGVQTGALKHHRELVGRAQTQWDVL